jgi:drug/metabolite transporter (DMT)-like permease
MLCGSVAFALMGSLAHGLGNRCDWQVIALTRSFLALVFAAALARAAGARLLLWRPSTLWVRSLAGSLSLACTFYALTRMPQSDVLTITSIFPVWVALLSWPLYGEAPSRPLWLSLACGLAGVALIQQPHLAEGNFGAATALAASLFTAVSMLGLHRLRGVDARAVVVHFSGVSALFCVAALFLFDGRPGGPALPDGTALLMLLGVGASATAGQLCLTWAFASGPPAKVSLVSLSQIPLALVLDVAFWGHTFGPLSLAGIALVLGPTAWVMAGRADVRAPD